MVPLVSIHQRFGQLGIEIIPQKIQLHIRMPSFNSRIQNPRVLVEPGRSELRISCLDSQEDLGYFRPLPFARQGADAGKKAVFQAIVRYAAEGDRMGRIEDSDFSFAELGEAAWAETEKELSVRALRPPQVKVQVIPPRVRGEPGWFEGWVKLGGVRPNFQWGKVKVYLAVRPEIKVEVPPLESRSLLFGRITTARGRTRLDLRL